MAYPPPGSIFLSKKKNRKSIHYSDCFLRLRLSTPFAETSEILSFTSREK